MTTFIGNTQPQGEPIGVCVRGAEQEISPQTAND